MLLYLLCMASFCFLSHRYRDIWRYSRLFVWKDELEREWCKTLIHAMGHCAHLAGLLMVWAVL